MNKYIGTIILLPLLVFNACGDDNDKCNDLTDDFNEANSTFLADQTVANCEAFYDDLLAVIDEGCPDNLSGSDFEDWTADSVANAKAFCAFLGDGSADGSFTNCFDGNDTYGPCTTCGYYDSEEDAQGDSDCITCPSGYEIDVVYDDCTGYCVEEGTATNPISSSDCTTP